MEFWWWHIRTSLTTCSRCQEIIAEFRHSDNQNQQHGLDVQEHGSHLIAIDKGPRATSKYAWPSGAPGTAFFGRSLHQLFCPSTLVGVSF
jgi:hypothetical protein